MRIRLLNTTFTFQQKKKCHCLTYKEKHKQKNISIYTPIQNSFPTPTNQKDLKPTESI